MKKSELKPGMKVYLNLQPSFPFLVIDDALMADQHGGWMPLSDYEEDLSKKNGNKNYFVEKIEFYDVLKYIWVTSLPDYLIKRTNLHVVEMQNMDFSLHGRSHIVVDGNKTKVLFTPNNNEGESFEGVSTCMPGDTYNKKKGIRIATYKALAKYVENELKKMSK